MITVPYFNERGEPLPPLTVDEGKLGDKVKRHLLRQTIQMYESNNHQGTHKTKSRSEVKGSGRKLYRQKGTGRARAGDLRSPLRRKGGRVFGPQPRSYRYDMPRKAKREALRSAFLAKLKDGEAVVVERFPCTQPKTKPVMALLSKLSLGTGSLLVGSEATNKNLWLSLRNVPHVDFMPVAEFNPFHLLHRTKVIFTKAGWDLMWTRCTMAAMGSGRNKCVKTSPNSQKFLEAGQEKEGNQS